MSSSFYSSTGSDSAVYQSAQDSADNAETSATEAAASLAEFKNLYMGSFQTAPTALQDGSLYYNENTSLLYYWNGTAWTATNTSVATTDDLVEGTTNLFVTDERIDDRVDSLLTAGSNITLTYDDTANSLTIASTATGGGLTDLSSSDTDDLSEGSANLYFTDARADARIAATDTDYVSEGSSNLYFTDERVDDRVNSLLTAGSNITLTYDDTANTLTVASTASGGGGGEDYVDIQTTSGTQPSASGTDSVAIGKAAVVGSSATNGISIGSSATVNGASSVSIGLNTSTSTNAGSTALGANAVANAANQLMLGAASGYAGALTSVRVGNTSYTPSDNYDLATKKYVDDNAGVTDITGENLADLSDVNNTTPTDGQVLTWDNTNSYWKPAAAASGGSTSLDYLDHGANAFSEADASAGGSNSLALGFGANASATNSIAIGRDTDATSTNAVRIGADAGSTSYPASGSNSIAVGFNTQSTGVNSVAIGSSTDAGGEDSLAFGRGTTASHDEAIALGFGATTTAANQLMLGSTGGTGLTSIRVGNTSYTPSNAMDLATKSYVDSNSGSGTSTFTGLTDTPSSMGTSGQYLAVNSAGTALEYVAAPSGGGTHPNIVTGTYTTTSTTYVDAGEIVDTDDGFTGAFQVLVHATIGTGSQASVWYGQLQVAYNPNSPGSTNWSTSPWFGNGGTFTSASVGNIRIKPRWDTATNKVYLQVKNGDSTSTVYTWTATLI